MIEKFEGVTLEDIYFSTFGRDVFANQRLVSLDSINGEDFFLLTISEIGCRSKIFKLSNSGEITEIILPKELTKREFSIIRCDFLGNFLIVEPRIFNENQENGFLFSKNGELLKSFKFGDAISDIRISRKSLFWLLYHEEGIFGDGLGKTVCRCLNYDGIELGNIKNNLNIPSGDSIMDSGGIWVDNNTVWIAGYSENSRIILKFKEDFSEYEMIKTIGAVGELDFICVGNDIVLLIDTNDQIFLYAGNKRLLEFPMETLIGKNIIPSSVSFAKDTFHILDYSNKRIIHIKLSMF